MVASINNINSVQYYFYYKTCMLLYKKERKYMLKLFTKVQISVQTCIIKSFLYKNINVKNWPTE